MKTDALYWIKIELGRKCKRDIDLRKKVNVIIKQPEVGHIRNIPTQNMSSPTGYPRLPYNKNLVLEPKNEWEKR